MVNTSRVFLKERFEVYDWLRGLASIAVICGHFKPFGLSKMYFVWSVHAFVIVTMVLIAKSDLTLEKLIRRVLYLLFVYMVFLLLFHPLFVMIGNDHSANLLPLLYNPFVAFIKNPYFAHLWYFVLYLQLLVFLWLFQHRLKEWNRGAVLIRALILSQIYYLIAHFYLKDYEVIFLAGWFFVMAAGWYYVPVIVRYIERIKRFRLFRTIVSFLTLVVIYSQSLIEPFVEVSENRLFLLNTLLFFGVIYFLVELFYLIRALPSFRGFKYFVVKVSRYTLALYIYHQGVFMLVKAAGYEADLFFLTLFCLFTGIYIGSLIDRAYFMLEEKCLCRLKHKVRFLLAF